MLSLIVSLVLLLLMLVGVPVAMAMGLTAAGAFILLGQGDFLAVMAQRIYVGTTGFTMLAIPFFILAGNLMNIGGITDRIYNFALACIGHVPGGLGHVNIFGSVIFAGMSGAAVADAAGLGNVEIKAMTDAGYDIEFSAGITAASSTIAPVIPPSIPFVVYGSIAGVSVGALFMAGLLPGIFMALSMAVVVAVISKKRNYPVSDKLTMKQRLSYFKSAILPLGTPAIILFGIWGGVFTPTEASAVACVYALFLGLIVYKEYKVRDLFNICWESLVQAGKTMFIIAIANFLSYFIMHQKVPEQVIRSITSLTTNPQLIILLIIGILLLLGCFVEGVAVIMITVPMFLPIINQIGMDLVQFGVVMILASMIGLLTPPVGMSLYAVSSISGVGLIELSKQVLPYVIGIFLVLLIFAYCPGIALFVPRLLGYGG